MTFDSWWKQYGQFVPPLDKIQTPEIRDTYREVARQASEVLQEEVDELKEEIKDLEADVDSLNVEIYDLKEKQSL